MLLKTKTGAGRLFLGVAGILLATTAAAQAETYQFYRYTDNSTENVAEQLTVVVTDAGSGQVSFEFFNDVASGTASSVTLIAFDDGKFLELDTDNNVGVINNNSGPNSTVSFVQMYGTANLPGGNAMIPQFEESVDLAADSDGVQTGINESWVEANDGESVEVIFDIVDGFDFDDIIEAMNAGVALNSDSDAGAIAQSIRVGIHVQGLPGAPGTGDCVGGEGGNLDDCASDTFSTQIPAPTAWLLAALGLGMVGWMRKRFA